MPPTFADHRADDRAEGRATGVAAAAVPSSADDHHAGPYRDDPASRGHIGRVVAGSLAAGLLAAALLVAAPFVPPTEAGVTGAVLGGWALGWAMLAALSVRFTDQPQRWAGAPALVMGTSGVLLLAVGEPVHEVLTWVWPPAVLALTGWMFVRVHRQVRGRSARGLLLAVLVTLALASIGGGYQTVREAADARAHAMPGRLIDVGGHRLHVSCTGSGSPTVVLEPGAGGTSSELALITPAVARDTRVCVYDRAGRGWSEPADVPQDAAQIATDLHTVLHRGRVRGPYVLAGHSFGGLYALAFAARYPDEVAGLVLVDSTAPAPAPAPAPSTGPEETTPSRPGRVDDLIDRVEALLAASGRLGVGRVVGVPTPSHLGSIAHEYAQGTSSMEQAASLRDLGGKPLVVLTAGGGSHAGGSAEQDALATLSTDSVHRVVPGVDHAGMVRDDEGAAATTRAIDDVVTAVRAGLPLAG